MKIKIFKLSLIALLLSFISAGCQKDDIFELDIGDENAVILKEIDGIEFKFCLLNKEGEPATIFNEGENFTFYFSVTNKSTQDLFFDPNFAYTNDNDFCRIYSSNNQNLGKPFIFSGYDKLGLGAYPFASGQTYTYQEQWIDDRDSIWTWQHGYYNSAKQAHLIKGDYYTNFKYRFRFSAFNGETLDTDTIRFKINFKIQ